MGLKRGQTRLIKKLHIFHVEANRPELLQISIPAQTFPAVSSRKIRCLFQRLARQAAGVSCSITLLRGAGCLSHTSTSCLRVLSQQTAAFRRSNLNRRRIRFKTTERSSESLPFAPAHVSPSLSGVFPDKIRPTHSWRKVGEIIGRSRNR